MAPSLAATDRSQDWCCGCSALFAVEPARHFGRDGSETDPGVRRGGDRRDYGGDAVRSKDAGRSTLAVFASRGRSGLTARRSSANGCKLVQVQGALMARLAACKAAGQTWPGRSDKAAV